MKTDTFKAYLIDWLATRNLQLYHLVGFILPLPLITQMFNASNLYLKYSHLLGSEKLIGAYFVGISLEISVFVCILAGSRAAGAWFAIISFFVGILFHDNWDTFLVDTPNLGDLMHITFHKEFYATTLLQLANSILGWFLSSLYIELRGNAKAMQTLAELMQKLAEVNRLHAEDMQKLAEVNRLIAEGKQELTANMQNIAEAKKLKAELVQTSEKLMQDITSLQKSKAAHTRVHVVGSELNGQTS